VTELLAQANGIELAYETFGERDDPALLLIMGLGSQMINWHEDFCEALASRGFFVIRYDNRDVGRSSRIEAAIDLAAAMAGDGQAPYTLVEMAGDAAALLDALDLARAHVVGVSMGGMIAQQFAISHAERVRSLCSIMSNPGDRVSGMPHPEIAWVLSEQRPTDREGSAAHQARVFTAIGSPGYPPDHDELLERGRRAFDRGISSAGYIRQLAAIIHSADRTAGLGSVSVPALVIHGRDDPLVDVSGGEATARAIPGSKLLLIDGMGHDLPRALWPQIIEAIVANAEAAS
jgi:pimeloyl-ACP methyl ester carboxylesterase